MSSASAASDGAASFPATDTDRYEAFRVPWLRHISTRLACGLPRFWIRCGKLESAVLADVLEPISIRQPTYIAGLARSGSTVLLETVASYPGTAAHRYRDFPYVFTPYWWNRFLDRTPRKARAPKPRVHADGLVVSPETPEALEEPIWMAFFRDSHKRGLPLVLDGQTDRPDFEAFYRNHLRKVLAIRGGERYVCKGNYHVARLEYLLKLFPDARFIIPVRRPRDHVASLAKQHRLFTAGETRYRRSLVQMQSCGHFEFGLDRRVMNLGDVDAVADVEQLWAGGEEARGWGRYWSQVYGYLARRLAANAALRKASIVVWFEDLCGQPEETLKRIGQHCQLSEDESLRRTLAARLHAPTYYRPSFSSAEESVIEAETCDVINELSKLYSLGSNLAKAA